MPEIIKGNPTKECSHIQRAREYFAYEIIQALIQKGVVQDVAKQL